MQGAERIAPCQRAREGGAGGGCVLCLLCACARRRHPGAATRLRERRRRDARTHARTAASQPEPASRQQRARAQVGAHAAAARVIPVMWWRGGSSVAWRSQTTLAKAYRQSTKLYRPAWRAAPGSGAPPAPSARREGGPRGTTRETPVCSFAIAPCAARAGGRRGPQGAAGGRRRRHDPRSRRAAGPTARDPSRPPPTPPSHARLPPRSSAPACACLGNCPGDARKGWGGRKSGRAAGRAAAPVRSVRACVLLLSCVRPSSASAQACPRAARCCRPRWCGMRVSLPPVASHAAPPRRQRRTLVRSTSALPRPCSSPSARGAARRGAALRGARRGAEARAGKGPRPEDEAARDGAAGRQAAAMARDTRGRRRAIDWLSKAEGCWLISAAQLSTAIGGLVRPTDRV